MQIRPAERTDLDRIENVYTAARAFMRASGNMNQWVHGYPQRELLQADIGQGRLFVIEEDGVIHGVFAFILGDDPTYAYIEDGKWPTSKPYGTIHRIGTDGMIKGAVKAALDFALRYTDEVRADTHADNKPMQHTLERNGFVRCGIIYLENGDPRIAYQYSKD
ncbi:MAG: GNAT family N-acetyltransferase [Clostridia bacterium]|nr:GNAT family N-acetyltransferase [Clostridia bacterium]